MTLPAIRPARIADLAGIIKLYQHLNADDATPEPANTAAAWAKMMRSEEITILVTEMARDPQPHAGTGPYALIENVVSHRAHRGQGLGRGILRAALDAAWQAGATR